VLAVGDLNKYEGIFGSGKHDCKLFIAAIIANKFLFIYSIEFIFGFMWLGMIWILFYTIKKTMYVRIYN
jgi:hypothetical protein